MKLSKIARAIAPSPTVGLSDMVRDLERQGKRIVKLEMGEPHFDTPREIVNAAVAALKAGKTHYSHSRGILELRQELCRMYNRRYRSTLDPQQNVIVTPGVKQGLLYVFYALLDPGDEVLVPNPGWTSYGEMVLLARGKPVTYDLSRDTDFSLSLSAIQKKRTRKTKALVLCSPSNPTGRVISKTMFRDIQRWCDRHNIVLISDEIYDRLIFDDKKRASILDVNPILKNAILLNGFSKSYAMTGWRLGYIFAERELITAITLFQQNSATCPSTFSQYAAIAALKKGERFINEARKTYARNRDLVVKELAAIPGVRAVVPEGGLYVFADMRSIVVDAETLAKDLLARGGVAVTPGTAFGSQGKGYIRICIAVPRNTIQTALTIIKNLYT